MLETSIKLHEFGCLNLTRVRARVEQWYQRRLWSQLGYRSSSDARPEAEGAFGDVGSVPRCAATRWRWRRWRAPVGAVAGALRRWFVISMHADAGHVPHLQRDPIARRIAHDITACSWRAPPPPTPTSGNRARSRRSTHPRLAADGEQRPRHLSVDNRKYADYGKQADKRQPIEMQGFNLAPFRLSSCKCLFDFSMNHSMLPVPTYMARLCFHDLTDSSLIVDIFPAVEKKGARSLLSVFH